MPCTLHPELLALSRRNHPIEEWLGRLGVLQGSPKAEMTTAQIRLTSHGSAAEERFYCVAKALPRPERLGRSWRKREFLEVWGV